MVRTLFALTHFLVEERLALCTNSSTVLFTDISHCRTLAVVFHCTIVYKQPSPFLHCLIRKLIMVQGYILVLVLRLHQTKYSVSCHSDFISGYCRLTVNRKSPNPPPSEVSEGCKPLSARTYLDMPKQHYGEHLIPTASSSVKTNNHPALLTSDPFLPTISPFSSVLRILHTATSDSPLYSPSLRFWDRYHHTYLTLRVYHSKPPTAIELRRRTHSIARRA